MECLKPVGVLLSAADCILAVEARLGQRRMGELGYVSPFQIANCIFAAAPRHPFLRAAVRRAFALAERHPSPDRAAVEDVTGPRMLTRLFFEGGWENVSVTPQVALMAPLLYPAVWPLNRSMFARHHTFGTWKEKRKLPLSRRWIERNRLPNPFPARLDVRPLRGPVAAIAAPPGRPRRLAAPPSQPDLAGCAEAAARTHRRFAFHDPCACKTDRPGLAQPARPGRTRGQDRSRPAAPVAARRHALPGSASARLARRHRRAALRRRRAGHEIPAGAAGGTRRGSRGGG